MKVWFHYNRKEENNMNNIKLGANLVQTAIVEFGDIFMINSDIGYCPYMLVSNGNGEGRLINLKTGRAYSNANYRGMSIENVCDIIDGVYVGQVTITIERK